MVNKKVENTLGLFLEFIPIIIKSNYLEEINQEIKEGIKEVNLLKEKV